MTEQQWTFEELEDIQSLMEKRGYSHDQLIKIYDLYNRVFNTRQSVSSCGKCNINKLNALRRKYEEERKKRDNQ